MRRAGLVTVWILVLQACNRSTSASGAGEAGPPDGSVAEAARALVYAYAAQVDCAKRAPFILDPQRNMPLVKERASGSCRLEIAKYDAMSCSELEKQTRRCSIAVQFAGESNWESYCIEKTPAGLRIDWRCSVGYNPLALVTFKVKQPTAPTPFRVRATLTDYYNYRYRSAKQTHYAASIRDANGDSIYGYIPRGTPEGEALFRVLEDGKEHHVMVELKYESPESEASIVTIARFLHEFWNQAADGN